MNVIPGRGELGEKSNRGKHGCTGENKRGRQGKSECDFGILLSIQATILACGGDFLAAKEAEEEGYTRNIENYSQRG